MWRSIRILVVCAFLILSLAAQQPNQPAATFLINATGGPPFPIINVLLFGGTNASWQIQGGANVPFMLVRAPHLVLPGMSFLGELVDLDLTDPSQVIAVFDGFRVAPQVFKTSTAGVWSAAIPVSTNVPPNEQAAWQAVLGDPAAPYGVHLAAASSTLTRPGLLPLNYPSLGNDGCAQVNTLAQWNFQIPFYATSYNSCWICANGYITFGSASSDFTPTNSEMHTQQPRIAPFWGDLDESAGGTITLTVDQTNPQNQQMLFRFERVPDWPTGVSGGIGYHTVGALIDIASGDVEIHQYPENMNSTYDVLIGISSGSGLDPTGAGSLDLSATLASGPYVGLPNEGMYEGFSGLTSITGAFPVGHHYDLVGWFWRYSAVGAGASGAFYVMDLMPAVPFP